MKIKLTNVGKRFNREWIFRHLTFEFHSKRSYAIIGPNGSGKSTLLQIIAGATLSRFFAFHVFVIPGMLLVFACLHVWMVIKLGINEWPMPGRVVRRSTYLTEYHELTTKDGRRMPRMLTGQVGMSAMKKLTPIGAVILLCVFPQIATAIPDYVYRR